MPETDELLILKSSKGDTVSFGKLVERYQHHVFNLALRMVNNHEDARDITQETFIKAFKSLAAFRYECGFKTWINRIASNTCLDHLRRLRVDKTRRIIIPAAPYRETVENIPDDNRSNPEEKIIQGERAAAVKKALGSLPETYRLPLLMQHYQKMSYYEISTALNIPEKTVATRLYRAKKMLKKLLSGGEYGEVYASGKKASGPTNRGVHVL